MTSKIVASRTLKYRNIDSGETGELFVEVGEPYLLQEGMVDFPFSAGVAGCSLRFRGMGTDYYDQEVYGADALQALQLACDVEGTLKSIAKKNELFFNDGEPYFE